MTTQMVEPLPEDFELYFDDSGTHSESPVAVAACYVASRDQWNHFTRNWNEAKDECGFKWFHMTDFMAKPRVGSKPEPYRDWDDAKRIGVYDRLTSIIRVRARHAFAMTVPKADYEELVPAEMRKYVGRTHYGWAVRCVMGQIQTWREQWGIDRPMQYTFSDMERGKGDICAIWDESRDDPDGEKKYGIVRDGFSFKDMRTVPPLQAADVLAWNMYDHHINVIDKGKDDIRDMSRWFYALRRGFDEKRGFPADLGFFSRDQLEEFSRRIRVHVAMYGAYPSRTVERLIEKEERRLVKAGTKLGARGSRS